MLCNRLLNILAIVNQGVVQKKQQVTVLGGRRLIPLFVCLRRLGYIVDYNIISIKVTKPYKYFAYEMQFWYSLRLGYQRNGKCTLSGISVISTPNRKIFVTYRELVRIQKLTITILVFTNKGLMTGEDAIVRRLGGILLCVLI